METRKEKYNKYREEIKLTPNSAFSSSKARSSELDAEDVMVLKSVDSSSKAISYGSILEPLEPAKKEVKNSVSPYEKFLAKKRRSTIIKLVLFAITVAALGIWFLLIKMGE